MNAPTTLPPKLEIPPRNENEGTFKRLFHIGRGYWMFYKDGVTNIWRNRKEAAKVQQIKNASQYSRAEFQLIRRTKKDFRKLPVFGLVLAVFGEFTPLIVLLFPVLTPSACYLPRQVNSMRRKSQERRDNSFETIQDFAGKRLGLNIASMPRKYILHCSNSLGLHSRFIPEFFLPVEWLKHRVDTYVTGYVSTDDRLILKHGGPSAMDKTELEVSLSERGLNTLNKTQSQMRSDLNLWLRLHQRPDVHSEILLWRPAQWKTIFNGQK